MIRYYTKTAFFIRKPGYLSVLLNLDHFDILGVNRHYNINKDNLELRYKLVKKKNDFLDSKMFNNYVNKAYITLKNDYDRAVYMLLLEGIEIKKDDKLTNQQCLEEIIQIHDKIDEGFYGLMALKEEVREKIEEIKFDFNEAIENKDLDKAKEYCILLSYYMKAEDSIFQKINDV